MKKLTTEEFIKKSIETNNTKYDYSLVMYITGKHKVKIICKEHGVFEQEAHAHMWGNGCPICPLPSPASKLSIEILNQRCYKLHKDEYSILSTYYINNQTKIKVRHNKCLTEYMVKPIHFSNGSCCPNCYNKSKGENKVKLFLDENNISYKTQHSFNECRYKQMLNFDFYLPELNICIEYDGRQHFEPVERFGGIEGFELIKIRDNIKNLYCNNNNIGLVRIPYTHFSKIDKILNKLIILNNTFDIKMISK